MGFEEVNVKYVFNYTFFLYSSTCPDSAYRGPLRPRASLARGGRFRFANAYVAEPRHR